MCSKEPYPGCRSNVSKVLGPDPTCPKAGAGTEGWVIRSGHDSGGLGDGWYESKLNDEVYTISTATSGSCAFGPSSPFRVLVCAARTLNPTGQARVTLSLR